ncbi:MAG: hypothetical protein ACI9R3_000125 [Verrucomicrobiales bacterium]|jgi:hypothetical protein
MKFVKWLLIAVMVIVAGLFAVSFLLPSKVHVERSITINAPAEAVYTKVKDLKKWVTWSPWNLRDPKMAIRYEGPESGIGQKSIWESESQGNGSQLITASTENLALEMLLDFGDQGTATAFWKFNTDGTGTRVVWGMDTELASPVQRLFGLVLENMVGPDYEEGLKNLKAQVEASTNSEQ